ncbi:MAG TPA: cation acetate symporter, partial [Geobacteraceae bacterium]|nr:cation acetate symporter [Geobacteraceae bacterium]
MLRQALLAITLTLLSATAALSAEPVKQTTPAASAVAAPAAPQAAQGTQMPQAAPAADAAKAAAPAAAPAAPAKVKPNRAITITMFMAIIGITLCVVVWAAKRTTSAADFYAAGGGITGLQNGWAIAGDYMSAASFLGMSGLISLYGIDGFMYAVGPMFSFIAILLVVAEPCRNAGKFTLG